MACIIPAVIPYHDYYNGGRIIRNAYYVADILRRILAVGIAVLAPRRRCDVSYYFVLADLDPNN